MRRIKVYCQGIFAGLLEELPEGGCRFIYDDLYKSNPALPPVSVNLPKSQKVYYGEALLPYFQSILPEGRNRIVFCTENRIDENDWFGMLTALADRDVPGAIDLKNE